MEEDRRKLLTAELAARIPYDVKCKIDILGFAEWNPDYKKKLDAAERVRPGLIQEMIGREDILYAMPCHDRFWFYRFEDHDYGVPVDFIKPYLRPLSSMTKKEREEYKKFDDFGASTLVKYEFPEFILVMPAFKRIDWLIAHQFDYRGLIEMGLALEAPKDMYHFE